MLSDGLTLQALLEHQDAGGLTLLGGPELTWATVAVEVTENDLPGCVTNGLAVLITPAPLASWQADALIRRVRDRGFTGLALTGDPIGAGSRALAERLGVVVLHVEHPTRLARACWQLLEARDALTLSTVQKIARSIEYQAHDLGDLLRHVAANVGHGIALIDREGVLQSAGSPVPSAVLGRVDFGHWLDIAETTEGFAASVPVESRSRHGLRVLLYGKNAGVAHRNALAAAVEVLMPIVAARLLIDEVEAVSDVSRSSGLLGDFLESRGNLNPEVEQRMLARGWRVSGYHLGFRMVARGRVDPLELLRFLTSKLALLPVDSHATTRGAGVIGWLTVAQAPTPAQLAQHVRDLHELHSSALSTFPIATGVGSLGSGSEGLATTLGEARDAARLAAERARSGWFVPIDSLGLEQLLLSWTSSDTFAPAAQSLLGPLSETERHTLAAYLDEESSVLATAQRLGLHRNTVSARIQRIQAALGADLSDPETRLALQLACRVTR
ncbi:PucR family transcriptional regulator [Terrabacter terrigena]|uniref:PucR family transcriptional regulator n=1 Tax=Terrabacter terrigena TaxID=574718 RepID=A0ABW3N343_9MICO